MDRIISTFLDLVNSVPSIAWEVAVEAIVGAVATSAVFVGVKKFFSVDSERKMIMLVIFGSMVMGALEYLRGLPQFTPYFALAQGAATFTVSQPVYQFFIKPLVAALTRKWHGIVTNAKGINEEIKSAAVPASGLTPAPADGVAETVEMQDFGQ